LVKGPCHLRGTEVAIPDIRSGAALVIAALCADGETLLRNAWHVERGYEDLAGKLMSVGAGVSSVTVDSQTVGSGSSYE
jgi:UDP-N-acetylglucosamine 1-carboxyvinyltransferase